MSIVIKHTNNKELNARKLRAIKELSDAYTRREGILLSVEEIKDLGDSGYLSLAERDLYNELLTVEALLDEN